MTQTVLDASWLIFLCSTNTLSISRPGHHTQLRPHTWSTDTEKDRGRWAGQGLWQKLGVAKGNVLLFLGTQARKRTVCSKCWMESLILQLRKSLVEIRISEVTWEPLKRKHYDNGWGRSRRTGWCLVRAGIPFLESSFLALLWLWPPTIWVFSLLIWGLYYCCFPFIKTQLEYWLGEGLLSKTFYLKT